MEDAGLAPVLRHRKDGDISPALQQLDQWLRSRIRQYIWKSWKKTFKRIKNLQQLGMSHTQTYAFANTRKDPWRAAHIKTLLVTITN